MFIIFIALMFTISINICYATLGTIRVPQDCSTIQKGIDAAETGNIVLVAPGTYFENINFLGKTIIVTSEQGPVTTIIDGDRGPPVVKFISGETRDSVLDGFTIKNASSAQKGGGIQIDSSSPTITNNIIRDNHTIDNGGGVSIKNGSPLIQNNHIANNLADSVGGGGIWIGGGGAEISGNTISNNTVDISYGGGIYIYSLNAGRIRDNIISGNTARMGGGIYVRAAVNSEIIQNLIIGNSTFELLGNDFKGGGIALETPFTTDPLFLNNTIADNHAALGSAFYSDGPNSQVVLINNNIIGTSGGPAFDCGSYGFNMPIMAFNNVYNSMGDAYGNNCIDPTGASNNISLDPQFVDPLHDAYHLRDSSPAIGAGRAEEAPDSDIEGTPRPTPTDSNPDIGAFEHTLGAPDMGDVVAPNVFEDFSSGPGDFTVDQYFSISGGRLIFNGEPSSEERGSNIWNGGINPGGTFPKPENTNYFENFKVSVDTFWEDRADNWGYGLVVCTHESINGKGGIGFRIDKIGSYAIGKMIGDVGEMVVDWTKSSLIATDGHNNNLSIRKVGPYFYFYINQVEVERKFLEEFHGGGVGVSAFHPTDASFDNFAVTEITHTDIEDGSNNVLENFNILSGGGFSESTYYKVSNGRYVFRGNRTDYLNRQVWNGGFVPGGWDPQPEDSNYFETFTVSVDTFWEGGADNYAYGIVACTQESSLESIDYIFFGIIESGWYIIRRYKDSLWETLVDWTQSSFVRAGGLKNNLSIQKDGSQFKFLINNSEVNLLTISGVSGGGVGLITSQQVDASYDDFSITIPGIPPTADAGIDQTISERDIVTLNGAGSSDQDDGIKSYRWIQVSGPPVVLSDLSAVQPSFAAPNIGYIGATLAFQLIVSDNSSLRSKDICVINVNWVGTGDIDENGLIDLRDAIIVLQVISGMTPAGIRSDYTSSTADADGNSKIGVAEAIYVLQEVSGL